jgi:hypothetical protein
MADKKISQLPAGAPAEPADLIPIDRSGLNYSLTAQDIANLGGGGSPGGVNTNVQFNNNGAFDGTNDFTTNGSGRLTLDNQDASIYVNGQNAAIWALGQNARLYANDGSGTNFIEAGVNGLVVGLVAYTDAQGRGTVNAEKYFVNGVEIASSVYTVATLPTLAAGSRAFVNDANAPAVGTFGIPVVAGGAFTVPVWCDGSVWYVG